MMQVRRAIRGAAAWAALAGLGMLSGCMSADPCGRPSLMSRLGCRPRCTDTACSGSMGVSAMPVSSGAITSELPFSPGGPGCCAGGPELPPSGDPLFSGPAYNGASNNPFPPPNATWGSPITLPPGASLPSGAVPYPGGNAVPYPGGNAIPAPPRGTLPTPTPEPGPMRLTPVPNGSFAQPTPANPSSRKGT
jgi:hypothetical protein